MGPLYHSLRDYLFFPLRDAEIPDPSTPRESSGIHWLGANVPWSWKGWKRGFSFLHPLKHWHTNSGRLKGFYTPTVVVPNVGVSADVVTKQTFFYWNPWAPHSPSFPCGHLQTKWPLFHLPYLRQVRHCGAGGEPGCQNQVCLSHLYQCVNSTAPNLFSYLQDRSSSPI